ncbi:hypothetical protein C4D60_Mb05t27990 [Musa balbisiana]|uniref:Arf-GAP domain-containing protein n=1 Tax=Musa balbisiana TaxID=52838 RepID=A0A4S8JZD0_MUSBA|nr:hypothetical protein C4D60_Mb05t27990 [Musa balbisiana]
MNGKASVSKELDEKHGKILEGLLKLPENKECADCKSKYKEKRWVPQNKGFKLSLRAKEEMASKNKQKSSDTDGEENNIIVKSLDKQDNTLQRTRKDNNVLPKIPSLVSSESVVATGRPLVGSPNSPELPPATVNATTTMPSKVDHTADLLNMLSVDSPSENGSDSSFVDDNAWSSLISPVALHQQQQPFLPQKKGFPMAADKSGDPHPAFSTRGIHQRSVSDSSTITGNISSQSWANFSYQVPGNVPLARQLYSNNSSQMRNMNCPHPSGSYGPVTASRRQAPGTFASVNGETAAGGVNKPHASLPTSTYNNRSLSDYDFSSLTQGMFSKH